jgi:hypothetical protein
MTERIAVIIGIILMVIAVAVVFLPFRIFEDPEIETLDRQRDPKGLKQAEVQGFSGNAVTNASIHVVIYPGCKDNNDDTDSPVFVVDGNASDDVEISGAPPTR